MPTIELRADLNSEDDEGAPLVHSALLPLDDPAAVEELARANG